MRTVSAVHMSPSCDQVLVSVKDQMITVHQLVTILMPFPLFVDSYNKRPSVVMTSIWLRPTANQLFPPPPPPLFHGAFQKAYNLARSDLPARPACSKIPLCIPPHMCRLFTEKRGILEGWRSARGLVAMVTNP